MITIHTDGGARGNPGPSAIGVVITRGEDVFEYRACIGIATNNVAEYTAVIEAFKFLPSVLPEYSEEINFFLDSELVVKQLCGQYKVKDPGLRELYQKVQLCIHNHPAKVSFSHVRRAGNAAADALVNQALDEQSNV